MNGQVVALPSGSMDAVLTTYHVDRGQCFVRERFGHHVLLDVERLTADIERTRFPGPHDSDHQGTADYARLARAADLIGQRPRTIRRL